VRCVVRDRRGVWSGAALGFSGSSDRQGFSRGNLYISATSERMKSAYSAPQARHWVARAILRAGRRGDEAMGEELMLTPVTRPRQHHWRMATHGKSWQVFAG
jgi:hypothetical protein